VGNHDFLDYDETYIESSVFKESAERYHDFSGFRFRQMNSDTAGYELRAIAKINDAFFTITAGSPTVLTKFGPNSRQFVFDDAHPKAFYDSMDFWNNEEGIAIGDATDGCLSVIITRDGGATWTKLTCNVLPKGLENEGAFAASDTNIAIVGDNTWVATTAGYRSCVQYVPNRNGKELVAIGFKGVDYSNDSGSSWKHLSDEGFYTIRFLNDSIAYAAGAGRISKLTFKE